MLRRFWRQLERKVACPHYSHKNSTSGWRRAGPWRSAARLACASRSASTSGWLGDRTRVGLIPRIPPKGVEGMVRVAVEVRIIGVGPRANVPLLRPDLQRADLHRRIGVLDFVEGEGLGPGDLRDHGYSRTGRQRGRIEEPFVVGQEAALGLRKGHDRRVGLI